jgi:hypothetical protein
MDAAFLSVRNAKDCTDAFSKFMRNRYNFTVDAQDVAIDVKKLIYRIMTQVHQKASPQQLSDLRELNNTCLNIARDFYVKEYKLVETPFQEGKIAERAADTMTGPARMGPTIIARDAQVGLRREVVGDSFDRLVASRKNEEPTTIVRPTDLNPQKIRDDECEDQDSFLKRFTEMEKAREEARRAIENDITQKQEQTNAQSQLESQIDNVPISVAGLDTLLPKPASMRVEQRYLCINGFDRDWTSPSQQHRFRFAVDVTKRYRYTNVVAAQVVRVVIPMEIIDERTAANVPKSNFRHEFSMAVPYFGIRIAEFSGTYDGPGDAVQGAVCQLVFESSYKAANGRGYVVLRSMQDERREFRPRPLDMLSRLTMSLVRPTGALFNSSLDDANLWRVEYDLINAQYLRLYTARFFDKNEFYKGDSVLIKGFAISSVQFATGASDLNEFINRAEGHDVLQIGQPNADGFYRSFYIQAPGKFDSTQGKFVVDQGAIDAVREYQNANETAWNSGPVVSNGYVLNLSLQVAIGMRIDALVAAAEDDNKVI